MIKSKGFCSPTGSLHINVQTISVQVGLRRSEADVSSFAMLQGPLSSIYTSVQSDGQQGLVFSL